MGVANQFFGFEYDASSDTSSYPYTALGDLGDLDIPEFLQ